MTGLSAVLGLTPMAIASGANIPLARAVVGGVIAAMVMVLFSKSRINEIMERETLSATESNNHEKERRRSEFLERVPRNRQFKCCGFEANGKRA